MYTHTLCTEYIHTYMYIWTYIYIYIFRCLFICIFLHTHRILDSCLIRDAGLRRTSAPSRSKDRQDQSLRVLRAWGANPETGPPLFLALERDLKGSFKGDIDVDRDVEVDVDIDSYSGCLKPLRTLRASWGVSLGLLGTNSVGLWLVVWKPT